MKNKIDFVGNRKKYYIVSCTILLITLIASLLFGVKLDIQFKGGTILTYAYDGEMNEASFKSTVEGVAKNAVSTQLSRDIATGRNEIVVSLVGEKALPSETQAKLDEKLVSAFPEANLELMDSNSVNPVFGREFFAKSMVAIVLTSVLMIVYIAFRFRRIGGWTAGVTAVVALINDVITVFAAFVIFGFPLDYNFVAVVLTILGYSINDTIVIYDRIRENERVYGSKMEIGELTNLSVNQTLMRTFNTTISTVIALVVVCIIALIFNVNSIITFALPMIVGMISGVYSSLCLATTLWVVWQRKINEKHAKHAAA